MDKRICIRNSMLIFFCGFGGLLVSLTGVSIGWMIGSLVSACVLCYWQPSCFGTNTHKKGIRSYWRHLGQCILGIELGQQISATVLDTVEDNWIMIISMLFLTIIISILSGLLLWRLAKTDIQTSFFGISPGGTSVMPSLAQDIGANMAIVSMIQMIRNFLVVGVIPIFVLYWTPVHGKKSFPSVDGMKSGAHYVKLTVPSVFWTIVLILAASIGYYVLKKIKLPSPWLLGSILGVSVIQTLSALHYGGGMHAWWPHVFIILAQILIGTSVGSCFDKEMFKDAKQVILVGLLSSVSLVIGMILSSFGISKLTGLPFVTAVLAFAPGGVAAMTTTSLELGADTNFVVAFQTLRLVTILIILPPSVRLLKNILSRKIRASV